MIEVGKRYRGKVTAADFYESQKETLGLQLEILPEDEQRPLYHVLWITEKTRERTAKTLSEFGIDARDKAFWRDPAARLRGQDCDFSTKLGQNGKPEIEWLNGPLRKAQFEVKDREACVAKAAALFSEDVPW